MIRKCKISDASKLCKIYNYYILNETCTFETKALSTTDFQKRIFECTKKNPWIVYEENAKILGYAYAKQWNPRAAYDNTKEVSIYIDHNCNSSGIGSKLYSNLIDQLRNKCHVLLAVITLPNESSVNFHEKFDFKKVGHFKEVGYKFNKWLDVGYWELII